MSNFELAADAIVSGDIDTLTRLLDASPELIHERSTREHGCTLLHYVGANGFEEFRQKSPQNAVEIAKLLLDRGAPLEVFNCYGGTVLDQALWSAHNGEPEIDFVPVIELLLAAGAKTDVYPEMKARVEKVLGRSL